MGKDKLLTRFYRWLANKLPRELCYFAYIRVHAEATCTKYSDKHPSEVTWDMALDSWGTKK